MMHTQVGRPGDPATRRPGDPATRLIIPPASSPVVKPSRERMSLAPPSGAPASATFAARKTSPILSNMVIALVPDSVARQAPQGTRPPVNACYIGNL